MADRSIKTVFKAVDRYSRFLNKVIKNRGAPRRFSIKFVFKAVDRRSRSLNKFIKSREVPRHGLEGHTKS